MPRDYIDHNVIQNIFRKVQSGTAVSESDSQLSDLSSNLSQIESSHTFHNIHPFPFSFHSGHFGVIYFSTLENKHLCD